LQAYENTVAEAGITHARSGRKRQASHLGRPGAQTAAQAGFLIQRKTAPSGRASPCARHHAFKAELACTISPSSHSRCSLKRMPGPALASVDVSAALRTCSGPRRRSLPFSSIRSKAMMQEHERSRASPRRSAGGPNLHEGNSACSRVMVKGDEARALLDFDVCQHRPR